MFQLNWSKSAPKPLCTVGWIKNTYRQVFVLATPKFTAFGYGKIGPPIKK